MVGTRERAGDLWRLVGYEDAVVEDRVGEEGPVRPVRAGIMLVE